MKSKITIEVDFEHGNIPVIQILQVSSDDVRDKLIKSFTEQCGGSSWLKLQWHSGFSPASPVNDTTGNRIFITPIPAEELKVESEIMLDQFMVYEKWKEDQRKHAGFPPQD